MSVPPNMMQGPMAPQGMQRPGAPPAMPTSAPMPGMQQRPPMTGAPGPGMVMNPVAPNQSMPQTMPQTQALQQQHLLASAIRPSAPQAPY